MIEEAKGNLLTAEVDALVNTVNCVGVMGKGIALQFKQAYPAMNQAYKKACERGDVEPGRMFVWEVGGLTEPRFIINFPTKRHWKGKSKYHDIEIGLNALVAEVKDRGIRSIAIPPLGCGHGGLAWPKVREMIESAFAPLAEVRVLLYAPAGAPAATERVVRTKRPRMTRARALFVLAMQRYSALAYETSQLEIQKLAYFLQEAGEQLRLKFTAQQYGPYAENLNKVLEDIEGHLISGFDGSRAPDKVISLMDGAISEAQSFLSTDVDAQSRMDKLGTLIEGFETPYGMELLSSVHWVACHDPLGVRTSDDAVRAVHAWNTRKAKLFPAEHIKTAWKRLVERRWLQV
jgi:O-acetyl-ADP-ribose deacetylase (regulator of RNase III)